LNCDSIARWYRWLEYAAFGGALRRRREGFLLELGNPRTVLVLGDGDGRFLQAFCALYPKARVDAIDVSAGMIELAKARVASERVTFHLADAREFPRGEYDVVAAHFFFDCFEERELQALTSRFAAKQFLISEFRRTWWSGPLLAGLYLFFHIATGLETRRLTDHRPMLEHCGYRLDREENALGGLLASELWRLSAPLKNMPKFTARPPAEADAAS
jgi:SAM-dependent methyltransferase